MWSLSVGAGQRRETNSEEHGQRELSLLSSVSLSLDPDSLSAVLFCPLIDSRLRPCIPAVYVDTVVRVIYI